MNDPLPPAENREPSSEPRDHPRVRYRGAFRISLGISAVLHVVAVALYPSIFPRIPQAILVPGGQVQPQTPQGTELINIQELPEEPEPEVLPPEEEPEPEVPVVPVQVSPSAPAGPPGPEEPVPGNVPLTAADRIKPRAGDLRFWAPVNPELNRLSDEEIMRIQLIAELEALGDSVALAEELARRSTDWTYTDEEGRKWGVSPGKLHLGDITLPLPAFGAPPGNQGGVQRRMWEWDQIERGAATADLLRSWKDRDAAIRARKNAERRPDTTGVRR